jgi:hypothetical protein
MTDGVKKLDPEQQRLHEQAFERWVRAEREVQLANTGHRPFIDDALPDVRHRPAPTVVMERDQVLRFRASHELLLAALADLVGVSPQEMTQMDAISSLLRKHYAQAFPERLNVEVQDR